MQLLDNTIIIILIVMAFLAGKKISDSYHERMVNELLFQLRLKAAERGVGYVPYPVAKKPDPIGQDFMDRLKETGRATQSIQNK